MARPVVQSTYLSSFAPVARLGQIKGYGKTNRTVKMIGRVKASPIRMTSFSGLRGSNAFGTMITPGIDFHFKVAAPISNRQRKSSRFVPRAMFERFTDNAIKVIVLSQEEARRLSHNFIGTEHILLGLIGDRTGIAAKVLKSMTIHLKDARVEVEKIIGRGSGFVGGEVLFSSRAKHVLELSLEEARHLGHNYIGTEHLLLGLLGEGEGVAGKILESLGADPKNIRTQVIRMVGESSEAAGADVGGGSSGNKMPDIGGVSLI